MLLPNRFFERYKFENEDLFEDTIPFIIRSGFIILILLYKILLIIGSIQINLNLKLLENLSEKFKIFFKFMIHSIPFALNNFNK